MSYKSISFLSPLTSPTRVVDLHRWFVKAGISAWLIMGIVSSAFGSTISWTNWTGADRVKTNDLAFWDPGYYDGEYGAANGTLVIGSENVKVDYFGGLLWAQVGGVGFDYWNTPCPSSNPDCVAAPNPYLNSVVGNAPKSHDLITLTGYNPTENKGWTGSNLITFSKPVIDPIMTIVSLGQPIITVGYQFELPFVLLSAGQGYWGGNQDSLRQITPTLLEGTEGSGAIQFKGEISSIAWQVTDTGHEPWHGFSVGAPVPEPSTLLLLSASLAILALLLWCRAH